MLSRNIQKTGFSGLNSRKTRFQFLCASNNQNTHCVKCVQIRSFPGPCFTKYLSVFSANAGKYGPEKTPYLDTFQAVTCAAKLTLILSLGVKVMLSSVSLCRSLYPGANFRIPKCHSYRLTKCCQLIS